MLLSCLATGAMLSMTPAAADVPASAVARAADAPTSLFQAPPLSDNNLAEVYGTGIAPSSHLRQSARDDFESFSRVTAQTMPVTFENWFSDVATPLIVDNLIR